MNPFQISSIMKTQTISRLAVTCFFLFVSLSMAVSQKSFEGVFTYKITYPGNAYTESQMAMFPKIMTITIKGNKAKSELQTQMGAQMTIFDYAEKNRVALINMMGQKYAIKETTEDIQKEINEEPVPTIEYVEETKLIAGHTCKKALVEINKNGNKTTYEVWYSTEFGAENANFDNPLYKDIKGVLMEFSIIQPQFTMKFSTISVEKKKISPSEFDIPADYVLTTMEELESKMGGM
jgi:hypothetical protein